MRSLVSWVIPQRHSQEPDCLACVGFHVVLGVEAPDVFEGGESAVVPDRVLTKSGHHRVDAFGKSGPDQPTPAGAPGNSAVWRGCSAAGRVCLRRRPGVVRPVETQRPIPWSRGVSELRRGGEEFSTIGAGARLTIGAFNISAMISCVFRCGWSSFLQKFSQ